MPVEAAPALLPDKLLEAEDLEDDLEAFLADRYLEFVVETAAGGVVDVVAVPI